MFESVSIRSQSPPTTPTQPPHLKFTLGVDDVIFNLEHRNINLLMTGCNQLYFWSVCAEHFGLSIDEKNIEFYMDKPTVMKELYRYLWPFQLSNLWWMPNSVNVGGLALPWEGFSNNFQQYFTSLPDTAVRKPISLFYHAGPQLCLKGLAKDQGLGLLDINLRLKSFVRIRSYKLKHACLTRMKRKPLKRAKTKSTARALYGLRFLRDTATIFSICMRVRQQKHSDLSKCYLSR